MGKMKGISLPLEIVVLLILAAIVLAALMGFFLQTFTPTQSKTQIIQTQTSLCQQMFFIDSQCRVAEIQKVPNGNALIGRLQNEVCGKPSDGPVCTPLGGIPGPESCIKGCCRMLCPA